MTNLILFNIETDENSKYLSANLDWIESLATKFDQIKVYSTHVGKYTVPSNVTIRELGGGSTLKRVYGFIKLIQCMLMIIKSRKKSVVFYHMVTRVPSIISLPLKLVGVKQALWYSHSSKSLSLKWVVMNVNYIFTPTKSSFPIESHKVIISGQGISSENFSNLQKKSRKGVISVGRVVPIKQIELFISAYSRLSIKERREFSPLTLVGDLETDKVYLHGLEEMAAASNLKLCLVPQIPRHKLINHLNDAKYYFMGTPKSLDKAAVEAAMSGCLVLTQNPEDLQYLGLCNFWKKYENEMEVGFVRQMQIFSTLPVQEFMKLHQEVALEARKINNIDALLTRISKKLTG
jgi:glycosyltransferase involved in cell wall biosynthesis